MPARRICSTSKPSHWRLWKNKTRNWALETAMGKTTDIGVRVELVSLDPYFENISIGLYRQDRTDGVDYLVKTYSARPGAAERISVIRKTMSTLGDLETNRDGLLCFSCGEPHEKAMRRIFIDACKLAPGNAAYVRSLTIYDKKSDAEITAESLGGGSYKIVSNADPETGGRRVFVIARGLLKLTDMTQDEQSDQKLSFLCGHAHDALVGALMVRAQNVRAAMREAEELMSRGVLAAPNN